MAMQDIYQSIVKTVQQAGKASSHDCVRTFLYASSCL